MIAFITRSAPIKSPIMLPVTVLQPSKKMIKPKQRPVNGPPSLEQKYDESKPFLIQFLL
jgi:hypothetical protein